MESFYVVEGEITLYISKEPGARASAGSFAHLPSGRNSPHGHCEIKSETARYLILTTPRHGQFYRAILLPSRAGWSLPLLFFDGSQIKQASKESSRRVLVGPLPNEH